MTKKLFPPPYDVLTELLVAARRAAGVTQKDLAERLLIGQSTVSKIERGVQRLDLVELHRWLSAIGRQSFTDFARVFDERVRRQRAAESRWAQAKRFTANSSDQVGPKRKA